MNTNPIVKRDERSVAVENASFKWGFNFVIFALFFDVFYRGAVRHEAAWDLLGLIVISCGISAIYQVRQKTAGRRAVKAMLLAACVAGVVAFVTAIILAMTKAM